MHHRQPKPGPLACGLGREEIVERPLARARVHAAPGVLDGENHGRFASRACRPHDDFCALWHLFDLLADGSAGWKPKYSYP